MSVLVLHNPVDHEKPDSLDTLHQAEFIATIFKELGREVELVSAPTTLSELTKLFKQRQPALIFNLIETWENSDHLTWLPVAVMEAHNISYTGVSSAALLRCANKKNLNQYLAACGIPIPSAYHENSRASHYIVKSALSHASYELHADNIVSVAAVPAFLAAQQARLGGIWLAEEFIEGREFNIALIQDGNAVQTFPPAEILFPDHCSAQQKIFTYAAKWDETSDVYDDTRRDFDFPEKNAGLADHLSQLAKRCWHLLGLSGYARIDFRLAQDGTAYVIDINPNPCIAPDAGFMAAAARMGMTPLDVVHRLSLNSNGASL